MAVVAACVVAVAIGLVAIWRWGGIDGRGPDGEADPIRRYLWDLNVGVSAGLMSGLLVAGPGGRLVMRLLAVTAGDGAQGRLTEADEVVGKITLDGTIGFVIFVGLLGGMASGVGYVLIRRWLPSGRVGGLVFGALLLVVFAPRIDPVRRANPDFDLVGPGWLALLAFGALLLVHGMTLAAFAARFRSTLPPLAPTPRVLARYMTLALAALFAPLGAAAVVGAGIVWTVRRRPALVDRLRSRAALVTGRAVLGAGALVALPGFVGAVADIAGRGP
ncbi:MAG: hypothetical protein QOJ09_2353 [Actinomycetota bacterium]|jgi:hypothetical protein|nr:hypothetical protein [Actinomycetota bacterium]